MRDTLIKNIENYANSQIEQHRSNIEYLLNTSDTSKLDVFGDIQSELDKIHRYENQIKVLHKYFLNENPYSFVTTTT